MLQRAHEFSENIYGDDYNVMLDYLKQCNSFSEHTEAKLKIIKRYNKGNPMYNSHLKPMD
jgi:hypothetical protein